MSEFIPFNFAVNLYNDASNEMLCQGYFSEVNGLELTMEPKIIAEGGRNWGEVQRVGPTKFSPIILKRGVTHHNDLWSWFDAVTQGNNYGYRLSGEIDVYGAEFDEEGERKVVMTWKLKGILPTKFKGPDLNSTSNQVAIEEVHLAVESLTLNRPSTNTPGQPAQEQVV